MQQQRQTLKKDLKNLILITIIRTWCRNIMRRFLILFEKQCFAVNLTLQRDWQECYWPMVKRGWNFRSKCSCFSSCANLQANSFEDKKRDNGCWNTKHKFWNVFTNESDKESQQGLSWKDCHQVLWEESLSRDSIIPVTHLWHFCC